MDNFANIYDIDGKKLRGPHKERLTVDEAKKRIDEYTEKLKDCKDKHKEGVYTSYIRNLTGYIQHYFMLHPEYLQQLLKREKVTDDQITKAMEELKESVANEEEYTEFEEVKES